MIKLYIANLGKYNEGHLIGSWLELPATEEQINNCYVKAKLGYYDLNGEYQSGYVEGHTVYEECAIHDFECNIEGIEIKEYSSISDLNDIAEVLDGLNGYQLDVLEAMLSTGDYNIYEALDKLEDSYLLTSVGNEEDLGRHYIEECGCLNLPDYIKSYFDYEAYGRDCDINNPRGYFTDYGYLIGA